MVNLELFDLWLEKRRYITNKIARKIIILIYKGGLKNKNTILDFEKKLEELGLDEIAYLPISKYIWNWNYRNQENKRIRKEI